MMRFHLRGLVALGAFAALVFIGLDARLGAAAILAAVVIDWLSFALPLGLRIGHRRRPRAS